jgi:hypothetical protein
LSNEEKTIDYEHFEKGMIYMKILKKGGVVEKRGEEEAKSMPHVPVVTLKISHDDMPHHTWMCERQTPFQCIFEGKIAIFLFVSGLYLQA